MDFMINIIITAAIVLFILKRMTEVARKGKDITGPPVPESMFGEDEEEPAPSARRARTAGEPPPAPRRFETVGEPFPRPVQGPPPVPRRFEAPSEPPAPRRPAIPPETAWRQRREGAPKVTRLQRDESVFETAEEEGTRIREPSGELHGMRAHASGFSGRRTHGAGFSRMLIGSCFSRDGLVRGVIMSEILGPPVGMRNR